jgi:hypothetical protein
MVRWVTAALALGLVGAAPLGAADKAEDGKKPLGTWTRKIDQGTVTFQIKADGLHVILKGDDDHKIDVAADYGVTKDGVLFGRVNKVTKENVSGGPEDGDLFSFRFKVEKGKLTVSDLNSSRGGEQAKQHIEGEYEQQKDK